jgi:hypothetical protein
MDLYADSNAAPIDVSISEYIIDDTALWTTNFTPPDAPLYVVGRRSGRHSFTTRSGLIYRR